VGGSTAAGQATGSRRSIVPLQRCFAVVGYAIGSLIIIVVLLELGSFVLLSIHRRSHPDPVAPNKSPAYDGEPWAGEFWKEQEAMWKKARSSYLPFMIWGPRQWHSQYINTDQTEMGVWRRTIQAMGPACREKAARKVWVFGGSTVYGISAPDSGTIPSYLARELNRDPQSCFEVTNLGAEGYVTNQEVILLIQELKEGRRPDIAIFYDGINDSIQGGFFTGTPSAHWQFEAIQARLEDRFQTKLSFLKASYAWSLARLLVARFLPERVPQSSDAGLAVKATATLDNYEANLRLVQVLAPAYGFRAYFFWQPTLGFGDKPLGRFEKELKEAGNKVAGGQLQRGLTAVYQEAERRSAAHATFVFLGHVFDGLKEPIYSDGMHLAPRGNEMIARTLAQQIGLGSFTAAKGALDQVAPRNPQPREKP
jgi:lysophospholipase L1-like esterase